MLSFVFSHFTPNLGEELDMGDIRFLPFYEKLTIRFPGIVTTELGREVAEILGDHRAVFQTRPRGGETLIL